jgi:hypothetical protein
LVVARFFDFRQSVFRRSIRLGTDEAGDYFLDDDIIARARAAGLDLALRDFPEDVAAAAGDALSRRIGFTAPDDPTVEPWPPMQAGDAL